MAQRQTYTHDQLDQYFDRVCLPKTKRIFDVSSLSDSEKLNFLNFLQKHQLVKVPWENLTQHYSWHRVVNVKPQHLFNKIVHSPGRGGYCMEANYFYHTVLLSLGFNVFMAGSRIYRAHGEYGGWTHVVNLVNIAGTRYLLDGGFGPEGPSRPFPLNDGEVSGQIAPAQMRLLHESIPQNLDQSQKVWVTQHRYDESHDWKPIYCFVDFEFTPIDIEGMNFAPWLNKQTFFTHKVVAARFTTSKELDRDGNGPGSPDEETMEGEIDGSLTINQDVMKWRRGGEKVVEWKFNTEEDRLQALKRYFGIQLAKEDEEAIAGTASALSANGLGS